MRQPKLVKFKELLLDSLMSPKVSSQGFGMDSNTLAIFQRDQGQVVRGKRRCAKIVISPIWQSGRGSRVLLCSILTFVQLQEYVCHHKQSETDCIQLICVPTCSSSHIDLKTPNSALAVGKRPCELATASLDSCSCYRRVTFLCRLS